MDELRTAALSELWADAGGRFANSAGFGVFSGFLEVQRRRRKQPTLRSGNTVAIQVFQDPKLDRTTLIGPSGMISFPLVGEVRAAGL